MDWAEVERQVRQFVERCKETGSQAWYRGERTDSDSWTLKSTLHRHVEELTKGPVPRLSDAELREILIDEAKMVFRRFQGDAWSLLHGRERSDWGVLFAMQHFGIPTRLLDFTESFACAVFFAQLKRVRGEAAVLWLLDPQVLNQRSVQIDGILVAGDGTVDHRVDVQRWHPNVVPPNDPLPSVAIAPVFTNPRMVAQRAAFVLTGDSFGPLDAQLDGELVRAGALTKLVLPPSTHDDADAYLATAGITAFNYYPDLEGLALKHRAREEAQIRNAKAKFPQFYGKA